MRKIKKDDLVQIITGKDRGKSGKVLSVDAKKNTAKASRTNQNGGILHQESPLDISNVMLMSDGKPTRVGFEIRDGKKVRIAKKTGKVID